MSNPFPTAIVTPTCQPAVPQVRGSTQVLMVLADPVRQVKAPEAFNHVFALAGIDAVVVPLQVDRAQLGATVTAVMASASVGGLFVSIPHKTALNALLPRLSDDAEVAGAANAVRRGSDGLLEGALFDGEGFVAALRQLAVPVQGCRVLLLGAGGAGAAIASALARSGPALLSVFDTDGVRAAALVQRLTRPGSAPMQVAAGNDAGGFDLVVNATPLGLRAGDPMPLDPSRLDRRAQVVDILMTAQPTPLLQACRARAVVAHPGHEMLVQQAPLYLDFFGYPGLAARLREPSSPWLDELRAVMLHGAGPG